MGREGAGLPAGRLAPGLACLAHAPKALREGAGLPAARLAPGLARRALALRTNMSAKLQSCKPKSPQFKAAQKVPAQRKTHLP